MLPVIVSSVSFIVGLAIITWMHNQYQLDIVVKPVHPPENAPLISVCIPARNEERNIGRCVEALLAQTYPNFEVVVLDDQSTDATPEILHNLRKVPLKIINSSDLHPVWAGKPHALTQAADAARGKWLCFVDVDTFVTLDALVVKAVLQR